MQKYRREISVEADFGVIALKHFPKLMKDINPQVQVV